MVRAPASRQAATIYVPDALPTDWKAGRTLSADDLLELNNRFTRMRGQLQFLYRREKSFGAQIAGLEAGIEWTRGAQRLELQGYARQPEAVRGVWPDQWAGAEVAAMIAPTRDMRGLQIEVWVPPQIVAGQQLRIEFGDAVSTHTVASGDPTTINLPLKVAAGHAVPLRIHAARSWTPSSDGGSADERPLAYRILNVVIEHR